MLLFNLNKHVDRPMETAKGINRHALDVQPVEPMFMPRPFEDYSHIPHQDESLMGYNQFGEFTATVMARQARRFGMATMNDNTLIIQLMNDKRRGLI